MDCTYFGIPLIHPAKSLIMNPDSIVSIHTASRLSLKRANSVLPVKIKMSSTTTYNYNLTYCLVWP